MTLAKAVFLNTFLRLAIFVSVTWGKGTCQHLKKQVSLQYILQIMEERVR